ncbi:uncharacterized protein LOC131888343 isoform X2 [Tigriopus californicus]|uniref:uncharacterized protein LOC131888343 isoform X2 n=1 Tax=Tigriopus californicus TaxID=6832 RepID=UPI0027DA1B9B|nr:uncharacterized protein LOC131888343 isoform X2 [Tigriopus californicus]
MAERPPHPSVNSPYGFVPFGGQNVSPYGPMFFAAAPSQSMPNIPGMMMMPRFPNPGPDCGILSPQPGPHPGPQPGNRPMFMSFYPAHPFMGPSANPQANPQANANAQLPHQAFNPMYPPMFFGYPSPYGANAMDMNHYPMMSMGPPDVIVSEDMQANTHMLPMDQSQNQVQQPDVVQASQDPTYMNDSDVHHSIASTYENNQPTYANELVPEASTKEAPSYMNNVLPRGVSVPPVFNDESSSSPIPPPRSRRGSQLSLNKSTHSLNMMGLEESVRNLKETMQLLKDRHPVHRSKEPPKRPPRRKDRLKRAATFATLPRNFKAHELDDITEDFQPIENDDKGCSPKVPMPGTTIPQLTQPRKASPVLVERPIVSQPGSPEGLGISAPTLPCVPMPGSSPDEGRTPPLPILGPIVEPQAPSFGRPPPTINLPPPPSIPIPEPPEGHNPTIPMPGSSRSSSRLSPFSQQVAAITSYTDEIDIVRPPIPIILTSTLTIERDTGETRISEVASPAPAHQVEIFLAPEVDHDYEDLELDFEVANKNRASNAGSGSETEYEDIDNHDDDDDPQPMNGPREVEVGKLTPDEQDRASSNNSNLNPDYMGGEREGSVRSGTSSNSITKTRKELLAGIREMDQTIQNLKIGIVKIYEDVFPKAVYAIPAKKALFSRAKSEGPLIADNPDYESVDFNPDLQEVKVLQIGRSCHELTNLDLTSEPRRVCPEIEQVEDQSEQSEEKLNLSSEEDDKEDENSPPLNNPDPSKSFRQAFYGIKSDTDDDEAILSDLPTLEEVTDEENTLLVPGTQDIDAKHDNDIPDNVSDTGTETLDVTLEILGDNEANEIDDHIYDDENDDETIAEFLDPPNEALSPQIEDRAYNWEEILDNVSGQTKPLMLQERLKSLKLDLLSSIFQSLYPTETDCYLVNRFISCPTTLEDKYSMMRLGDILRKNKKMGVELETLAEAMGQLARIGQELMRPEEERDPAWRSIPVAKEITITKGIAQRAPWEKIQGGTEILESLGYTEYTGFALQYPRAVVPEYFADHIGNLTVELVLAVVEISTLIVHTPPTMDSLLVLQESEPFPGNDPEAYYPEVPMMKVDVNQAPPDLVLENAIDATDPLSNLKIGEVQQPGIPSRNGDQGPESDYEEIGPLAGTKSGFGPGANVCDLCGTAEAMVRCQPCSNQTFCLACDDMYHRHPKRSTHARKTLTAEQSIRPPLPPKGEVPGPIAPPRRTSKKSSTPESIRNVPASSHRPVAPTVNPMATLPRKNSAPMMGRPLPAPPTHETTVPPPFNRSQSLQQPPVVPSPNGSVANSGIMMRQLSGNSQQFNPNGGLQIQPQQQLLQQHQQPQAQQAYNSMGQQVIYPPSQALPQPIPTNYNGERNVDWNNHQPYHEDFQFPPRQQPVPVHPPPQQQRFSRLNKSSSMHDIAHELAGNHDFEQGPQGYYPNEPISWEDQHWNTTQSVAQAPPAPLAHRSNFRRSTSSKSLHQDFFNANPMWSAAPPGAQFHPMMGGIPPWGVMNHPNMSALNRSMHDLHLNGQPGFPPHFQGASPNSQRPKKGGRARNGKMGRNQGSRSQSRNASRSSRRGRRGGGTSGTSEDSESDDEDFFTGESDADFVSLSSGSNPRRAPRKSWTCEHCTYVNNPGVSICVVCCRTSTYSRGPEEQSAEAYHQMIPEPGQVRPERYPSSEEEEEDSEEFERRRLAKSKAKSHHRKRGSEKGKAAKSPRPRTPEDQSDLEQDVLDTYYAVRMGNPDSGRMEHEDKLGALFQGSRAQSELPGGVFDSSSETGSSVNNMKASPNFSAIPAKGILKKCNSNPQLTKLEQMEGFGGLDRGMSDMGGTRARGPQGSHRHKRQTLPSQVVDINKYLKSQGQPRQEHHSRHPDDIWQDEKDVWLKKRDDNWSTTGRETVSPTKSLTTLGTENDYMSDVQSTYTDGTSTFRSRSGQSVGNVDPYQPNQRQIQRRTSETGKRNFRSKRFSKNLEPIVGRRSQSRSRGENGHDQPGNEWIRERSASMGRIPMNSESSTSEDAVPRVKGTPQPLIHSQGPGKKGVPGPGGIGSYLSRQEFGSTEEGQAQGDSGYVSHGSGTGGYPKQQLPAQAPIESFTMSVDRGFLGRNPAGDKDAHQYRSMDDISTVTSQKSTGMELVRLLREAEKAGFKPEDLQCAVNHCSDLDPVLWLKENWSNMIDTVVTLATNAGHEQPENRVGTLSVPEARDALRKHKGNVWAAVAECVEDRQRKYDALCSKGNFEKEDILNALTAHNGDFEDSCQELNKLQLRPFLMRIWGQPEPAEVTSGAVPSGQAHGANTLTHLTDGTVPYTPGSILKNVNVPETENEAAKEEEETVEDVVVEEANPEEYAKGRQARRLLAEGKVSTYEKGELVVALITMYYEIEEAILAAEVTDTVEAAERFLQQECELCTNVMKVREICKMLACDHQCCQECAKNYFTVAIRDKSISDANCPFCSEPTYLNNDSKEDESSNYFARLDVVLKGLLDEEVHDLFQRKLRDRTLMKDPNFKWCYKCSSGFIANFNNKRLVCPDCRAMSCSKCLVPWESAHENISCQAFAEWKEANDPDNQAKGLEKHLEEHGITCPSCKFQYTLSRGGCMHFTCTQCKFEFCIGCGKPFKMGVKCGKDTTCAKMGLHAHHPRNCLFYLRDKEPKDLQKVLKAGKIDFKTEVNMNQNGGKCFVQVQKETNAGLVDEACNEDTPKGFGGYCQVHYVEYLSGLIFRNNVEPVSILDIGEMKQVFSRANHFLPKQRAGEYEFQFKRRLADIIKNEIPLESA